MIHYMTTQGVGDAWIGNELRIVRKAGLPFALHALNRPRATFFSSPDIAALEQDPFKFGIVTRLSGNYRKCRTTAALKAFGEGVAPGYPFWLERTGGAVFDSPLQKEIHAHYLDQAVQLGDELRLLLQDVAHGAPVQAPTGSVVSSTIVSSAISAASASSPATKHAPR